MIQTLGTKATRNGRPFSAETTLTLLTGGRRVPLAAVGPRTVRLRERSDLPPGPASVVATIDESVRYWSVVIPDGLDPAEKEVSLPTLVPENRRDGPPPGWDQSAGE